jgi:transposase-like protein
MPVPLVSQLERTLLAPDPLRALRELSALRAELDTFERDQVRRALESGASFAAVARALGITRQAAHRRYRHLLDGETPPRLVASAEALAVLQRARQEAARTGATTVAAEHVVRAFTAPRTGGPRSGRPPGTLEPRLFASLTRIEGTVGVDELLRAARALLDAEDPQRPASSGGRCAGHGPPDPARAA